MFYLHMAPPPTATPPSTTANAAAPPDLRLRTPSRPKSAAPTPTICVPTVAIAPPVGNKASVAVPVCPPPHRAAGYVGFSPRVPSAARLTGGVRLLPSTGNELLQSVVSAAPPPLRSWYDSTTGQPKTLAPQGDTITIPQLDASGVAPATAMSATTGNVYHAMTARKNAEETAKQLARRIAHFRAQEEKVLREVQQMKQRLERLLDTQGDVDQQQRKGKTPPSEKDPAATSTDVDGKNSLAARRPLSATTTASRRAQQSHLKTPRSKEQLQFLSKQRRVIQNRNVESARDQKEKRQAALDMHRQKDAAEQNRRMALQERIRLERQQAIDRRAAQQHQRLDELEQLHLARLRHEQMREMEAQKLINDMRDEETNLTLRLQALQLHQSHIKRGLEGTLKSDFKTVFFGNIGAKLSNNPVQIMANKRANDARRLTHFLSELRCPAFLTPTHERIVSPEYRHTLLLWLYAVYKRPALRGATTDDLWAAEEPTASQLAQWHDLLLGCIGEAQFSDLLHGADLSADALDQLLLVVETVHGRILMEERGDTTILQETSALIGDVAAHQASFFDDRCEIFPFSIQMLANELRHGGDASTLTTLYDDDIASLQLQLEALDGRIATAKDRLHALEMVQVDSLHGAPKDSKTLSQELGQYLLQCVDLVTRVTAMFKSDLAPWMNPPRPLIVGVGHAASLAYQHIDHVLKFMENTRSFADASRERRQLQATQDVAKDCHELIERISPGLRDQLQTLEMALTMAHTEDTSSQLHG